MHFSLDDLLRIVPKEANNLNLIDPSKIQFYKDSMYKIQFVKEYFPYYKCLIKPKNVIIEFPFITDFKTSVNAFSLDKRKEAILSLIKFSSQFEMGFSLFYSLHNQRIYIEDSISKNAWPLADKEQEILSNVSFLIKSKDQNKIQFVPVYGIWNIEKVSHHQILKILEMK